MMLIEEIRRIRESKKDLRKFGLTLGVVMLAIAALLSVKGSGSAIYWGVIGLLLVVLAVTSPVALKPLNKGWMTLAILLGWVMTRVILVILFYLVLTPTALIARLVKKDFLDRKMDRTAKTYWRKRERKDFDAENYERQF